MVAAPASADDIMQDRLPLPQMLSELTWSSLETIAERTVMIVTGRCSMSEYSNMLMEKVEAVRTSTLTMLTGGTPAAILEPWHAGATANAERLRAKRRIAVSGR